MASKKPGDGGRMTQEDWIRLLQPGLEMYTRAFEPTQVGADPNSVPNSALATLKVIGRSIKKSATGMGAWGMADLTLGLYKVSILHANAGVADTIEGKQVTNRGELEALLHWLKWAMAAYKEDKGQLAKTLGVPEDCVIRHETVSAVHKPAHYIAVDKGRDCVVLGVRGTHAASDVLTDLTPHSEEFESGYGHSGMLQSARWLMRETVETLDSLLRTYPGYDLILVGHSLGAGTAALLSMLLEGDRSGSKAGLSSRQPQKSIPNWCWAYACPPCVSKDLAIKATYINCIVLQDDVVARASPASLEELRAEILETHWTHALKDGSQAKTIVETVHKGTTQLEEYAGVEKGSFLTGAMSMGQSLLVTGAAKSGLLPSAAGRSGSGSGSGGEQSTASKLWDIVADTVGSSALKAKPGEAAAGATASTSAISAPAKASASADSTGAWLSAGAVFASAVYKLAEKTLTEEEQVGINPKKDKVAAAAVAANALAVVDPTTSKEERERQRLYTPGLLYHILRKPLPEGQEAPPLETTYATASGHEVPLSHGAGRGDTWLSWGSSASSKKVPSGSGASEASTKGTNTSWLDWKMLGWNTASTSAAAKTKESAKDEAKSAGAPLSPVLAIEAAPSAAPVTPPPVLAIEGSGTGTMVVAGIAKEEVEEGVKEIPHWNPSYDEGWDDKEASKRGLPKPMKVQHLVLKGTNPQSRFKRIVLSNTMLADHGTQSYRDGILDAMRYAKEDFVPA